MPFAFYYIVGDFLQTSILFPAFWRRRAAGQTQCANEEELGKVEESSNKIYGGSRYNNIWIDH